jgi:hypothetical protein
MTVQNNPLRQFFRRPAVFLTLPSGGKYYEEGVIKPTDNGELPVYPMTAIDEITARTPDALFNGEGMAQIIQSCVPNILKPWAINNIDLDAILIAIRSASGENDMTMDSICPKCEETNTFTVELNKILPQLRCPNYDNSLVLNDLSIKFRPLTYKELNQVGLEQFEVQRIFANLESMEDQTARAEQTKIALKKVTDTTMRLISIAIEYVEANNQRVDNKDFIMDFLLNCDKNIYVEIRDYTTKIREEAQIKPLHAKCSACSNEYDQPFTLNLSDFFA